MRLLGPIFSSLLLLCVASHTTTAPAPTQNPETLAPQAAQDVRLRKMHLVRPDLIHYPLCIEVCC